MDLTYWNELNVFIDEAVQNAWNLGDDQDLDDELFGSPAYDIRIAWPREVMEMVISVQLEEGGEWYDTIYKVYFETRSSCGIDLGVKDD